LFLLSVGLVSSLYLGHLHLRINAADGVPIDSFCNINQGFNCITVATSKYSVVLGIPVAFYGIEFFGITLAIVLLSQLRIWKLRHWESLVFFAMAIGLPVSILLASISVTRIHSICIMCLTVYGVVLTLFLMLWFANWGRFGRLLTEGPKDLLAFVRTARGGIVVFLAAGAFVSQFFWAPPLFSNKPRHSVVVDKMDGNKWYGLPTAGLTIGPKDAPIKIEEFTDFECPFCGRAHQVMIRLLQQFPGKIHLIHRDYPLDANCNPRLDRAFHPNACRASYYARCAARQGKYWPMETLLFANRDQLEAEDLKHYAKRVGLDIDKMIACVKSPATREAVLRDIKAAIRLGVRGTPTLIVNGDEVVVGLRDLAFWSKKIKTLLRRSR
jgi:protein-disulfide isomerase/uncharacterized membrane protein